MMRSFQIESDHGSPGDGVEGVSDAKRHLDKREESDFECPNG